MNVSPSHYLLNAFTAAGYDNITHIPNTLEIDAYPFKPRVKGGLKLLWVRSFSRIYNPHMALDVLQRLLYLGYDSALCMIGPDSDGSMKAIRERIKRENLPVQITGKMTKDEWKKQSEVYDIFINTTNFDNTPLSVIEAMALGLPVVSTDVGGIPYLVAHEKTGLLVGPDDAHAMADAVLRICSDDVLRHAITAAARKQVEQYDWRIVKNKWLTIFP